MARFITPPPAPAVTPLTVVGNVEIEEVAEVKETAQLTQVDLVDELPNNSITLHIVPPPICRTVSQEDIERMIGEILKDFSFMDKSDRLRLWRALIRKEEN